MHMLSRTQNGIYRTGLYTEGTTDKYSLIDKGDGFRFW